MQDCRGKADPFSFSKRPVAVIAYDDRVDFLCPLAEPSDGLVRTVESLMPGNSTNLYGGWFVGARLVAKNGRVILLSDGLANTGRYTTADDLARNAEHWYGESMVTTSTIGVGSDYDEALMSGMARSGGGMHYFAHTADNVLEAFSKERFSMDAVDPSGTGRSARCSRHRADSFQTTDPLPNRN